MLLGVVGGGAGGLAAALAAARLGIRVILLEKTDRCGHKLALTGGRRANFTHAESPREMALRFDAPPGLLLPLLRRFPYQRIINFFKTLGIQSKIDPEGCVWPSNADANELRNRLIRGILAAGGLPRTNSKVVAIEPRWTILLADGTRLDCDRVCLATGGASYPQTGSTGDGLAIAAGLGLETTPWFPALASLLPKQDMSELAGVTQPDVSMTAVINGKVTGRKRGNMIFAHRFVSGTSVLNLSGYAAKALMEHQKVRLLVDWIPALSFEYLLAALNEARIARPRVQAATLCARYLSRRLARKLALDCGVPPERPLALLNRGEVERLVRMLKATEWEIVGTEPIECATVTGGGVRLAEIEFATMEARRFPGLFCAGELLDTWAESGGYNLHFAWATGITVAEAIAGRQLD